VSAAGIPDSQSRVTSNFRFPKRSLEAFSRRGLAIVFVPHSGETLEASNDLSRLALRLNDMVGNFKI
jgi:hypothetical protein